MRGKWVHMFAASAAAVDSVVPGSLGDGMDVHKQHYYGIQTNHDARKWCRGRHIDDSGWIGASSSRNGHEREKKRERGVENKKEKKHVNTVWGVSLWSDIIGAKKWRNRDKWKNQKSEAIERSASEKRWREGEREEEGGRGRRKRWRKERGRSGKKAGAVRRPE